MAFGIYVHIPYCIQRCSYCDFATYEKSSILPPFEYIEFVKKEIQVYAPAFLNREVSTIYFGGGTPSLVEPDLLGGVLESFRQQGLVISKDAEITLEINPATISDRKIDVYCRLGINRFSVGAQTFKDHLLKRVGREHDSHDTVMTLKLLSERNLNYTFDLLFALPGQTFEDLQEDLDRVKAFLPPHLSAYCLTVPDKHPLAKVRLPENEQIRMFELIEGELAHMGMDRYEISNFARPGWESKHNMLYWSDEDYWGVGLSAHSYLKDESWGKRFWNPSNIKQYIGWVKGLPIESVDDAIQHRPRDQFEVLMENQSLTDFCHIFLRTKRGLSLAEIGAKFGASRESQVRRIVNSFIDRGFIEEAQSRWRLSRAGVLISNQIFEACTFLE